MPSEFNGYFRRISKKSLSLNINLLSKFKGIIIQQSGVVPYRIKDGKIEVLLISSRKKKRWVIPKGLIEPFMTPQDSAAKEALEEGGIIGAVSPDILGTYTYIKWGTRCLVQVFLLKVEILQDKWLESHRDRQWFSLKEAVKRVEEDDLKEILKTLPEKIQVIFPSSTDD
ncbi:MAG: hypothetical protein N5P05_000152 [Chroococcopsis gigantea SAG 12.99]|jgi:8-oxo-dGTP pyrophosphatase MutT (NUDIX family)|nr:NUDIX hydrolase [Chlorogloea purpurea SAG 13.99]MDV2998546.1 hypothetical protein [Chroococcopsis gigantea SAG 12.99]